MELRHLRYFVAVAETRHFGKAAERLHMAQPPLSQAIRQLETDMEVGLFTRTTRRVELTAAGEAFYTDALRVLEAVEDGVDRARRIAAGLNGRLRLGVTGLASYRQLPELAWTVDRELPGVELDVHSEMLTPAQEDAIADQRLDAGLLRPPVRRDDIAYRVLAREPLLAVLPTGHPLEGAAEVQLAELRDEAFVLYSAESRSVVNDAVVRTCLAAGFTPRREHDVTETSTLLALVAAGLGVALAPDSVRAMPLDGVVFRPVLGAEQLEVALAWRRDAQHPTVRNLVEVLQTRGAFLSDSEETE